MFELNQRNRNMSNAYLYSVYASSRDSCDSYSFASFCFWTFFLLCFAVFRWKNFTHLLLSSRLTNPNQIHSIHFLLLSLARESIEMMMMIACAYISYTSVSDINIYSWMGCRLNDTFVCDLFCECENSLMNTIQNAEYQNDSERPIRRKWYFCPFKWIRVDRKKDERIFGFRLSRKNCVCVTNRELYHHFVAVKYPTSISNGLYRHMIRSCISRKLNWTSDVCDGCSGCWIENFSENWLNPGISVIFNSTAEADQHIHRMMWHFRCSGCPISWPCIRQTCWQLIRSMRINFNVWTSAVHE